MIYLYICKKNKKMLKNSLWILSIILIVSSCVLPSKYQKAVDEKNRLIRENASLQYMKEQSKKDKTEIKKLKSINEQTEELLYEVNSKLTATKNMYSKCQQDYDKMLLENKKLLERAFADKTNLSEELAQKQKLLAEKERNLRKLEKDLNNQKLAQELLKYNLETRERNIDSLRTLIEMKDNKLAAIKKKIKGLLVGYSNDDILVEKRSDGRLYISLSQNLLFAKGSDKLDWKGKSALMKVAKALKSESGFKIVVEGHTDTDGSAIRNWELSTQRSLAVVRVLEENGVMPQKITAAGRGQYQPLLPNTTEANKSKNRRTEIILEPNVNDIINFLK